MIAFHKDTGKKLWRALTVEEIGYAPPILVEAAGKRQLLIWHTEAVNALNPATGEVYWTQPYPTRGKPKRPAVSVVTPVLQGDGSDPSL